MVNSIAVAAVVATLGVAASAAPAGAATFKVTSINDNGAAGTLRRAIVDANAKPGADVIAFSLPAAGSHTLAPAANLPAITDKVTIDGYSQIGATPATPNAPATLAVAIDAVNTSRALELLTDGSLVRGLVVKDSSGAAAADGIRIQGDDNRIEGNYVGTNRFGESLLMWNLTDGVEIVGNGNVVGGTAPWARNVIETGGDGVSLSGDANRVEGNLLGLDLDPGPGLGNDGHGVRIAGDGNVVGGAAAAARNFIGDNNLDGVNVAGDENRVEGNNIGADRSGTTGPGNLGNGVTIRGDDNVVGAGNVIFGNDSGIDLSGRSKGNRIEGNMIGADATGTAAPGNDIGVRIDGSSDNTVGGSDADAGNVISGNSNDGVWILTSGEGPSDGNVVAGNAIGTDEGGTVDLGNGDSGVHLDWVTATTVGTAAAGAPRNTIAFNDDDGVTVEGFDNYDTIIGNSIHDNRDLGIDLFDDGVTLNDGAPDGDGGPNDRQNFPDITSASTYFTHDGSEIPVLTPHTTVAWTLDSLPSTDFRIEFFSSPECDDSGHGEGAGFLGSVNVETDENGHAEGETATETGTFFGANVVATATVRIPIFSPQARADIKPIELRPLSSTSEFSPCAGS